MLSSANCTRSLVPLSGSSLVPLSGSSLVPLSGSSLVPLLWQLSSATLWQLSRPAARCYTRALIHRSRYTGLESCQRSPLAAL